MITAVQRLRPFSHRPGTCCLIPGAPYIVEAYPTLIKIWDFKQQLVKEVTLEAQGYLRQFTVMQDLERGCVTLFSERYTVHILPNLDMSFRKHPSLPPPISQEKLSLGSHKQQKWEAICERLDFKEIFPLWFQLGQFYNLPPRSGDNRGNFSLLKECESVLSAHRPEQIIPAFERLFLCGFGQMFVPRAIDEDHLGIAFDQECSLDSPLYLLSEGAALIRALFLICVGNEVQILPNLPPELFSGRFIHVTLPHLGLLNMEWSKKTIRQIELYAHCTGELKFHFPSHISRYRIRNTRNDKGKKGERGEALAIKSGSYYLLDQFQK